MKNFLTIILDLFFVLIIVSSVFAVDAETLTETQNKELKASTVSTKDLHPTKEEWLEVYLTHKIKQVTDVWKSRLGVMVFIAHKYDGKVVDEIVVTLSVANGEQPYLKEQAERVIDQVKGIVKTIVENYEWAKHYKITVQYI